MSNPDNHSTKPRSEQEPARTASAEVAQSDWGSAAHELTEAMQAVTNYVAAAQIEAGSAHSAPRLHEILHKASLQLQRANIALKQLRGHLE